MQAEFQQSFLTKDFTLKVKKRMVEFPFDIPRGGVKSIPYFFAQIAVLKTYYLFLKSKIFMIIYAKIANNDRKIHAKRPLIKQGR